MNILGISALYHDSAACLIQEGEIIAAAQEERFTRIKHDSSIPKNAMLYCLNEGGVGKGEIDIIMFYDKPITKFVRLINTYIETAPFSMKSFLIAIPAWIKQKSLIPYQIEKILESYGYKRAKRFLFSEHHLSHAASAFFPSPFSEAAIISLDGVGEKATTSIFSGEGNTLKPIYEIQFPHSIGLLYSAFTYFTGFKVNSGEYKLMGLAPYGEPIYVDKIKDNLIEIKEDGSFRLNMKYFGFMNKLTMTNKKFEDLCNGPARKPESIITQREMDLAKSIQVVTEEILLKISRFAKSITGKKHLCLAGGVALNCVANGKLLQSGIFDNVWIQPASGDAGGSIGAALYCWHQILGNPRIRKNGDGDSMNNSYLGPSFKTSDIEEFLTKNKFPFKKIINPSKRASIIANLVDKQKVVGLFNGKMEFGPRALGNRSIIADARNKKMQSYLNLAIKFRESFRPFAPVVLEEDICDYFEIDHTSPYMLLVYPVKQNRRIKQKKINKNTKLKKWINNPRSDIPAITHVDYSARVQTINIKQNPFMYRVLKTFKKLTGYSIMINTSLNIRSEPIVCTPQDAYKCFMRTGMDILVLENLILFKDEQPPWHEDIDWQKQYALD